MTRALLVALPVLLAMLAACDPPPPPPGEDHNVAPRARLIGPQLVQVGVAGLFDASQSDDEDGEIAGFDVVFSDGTVFLNDDDGVVSHVFVAAGRYAVSAEAIDDDGARALAEVEVVVVEGEVEACDCGAPCLDDGVCEVDVGCAVLGVSDDVEEPEIDVVSCE